MLGVQGGLVDCPRSERAIPLESAGPTPKRLEQGPLAMISELSIAVGSMDSTDQLDATLASARTWSDDVFVVGDPEGLPREHVRWIPAEAALHAAARRNAAIAASRRTWLLWLLPGEQIRGNGLAPWLESTEHAAARVRVRRPVAGVERGDFWEACWQVRLTRTDQALRFTGRVGEKLAPATDATMSQADFFLETPRDDFAAQAEQTARWTLAAAQAALQDEPNDAPALLAAAEALEALGRGEVARDTFRRAVPWAEAASSESLAAYYGWLGAIEERPETLDERIAVCVQALEMFPVDAQLLCLLGALMQQRGQVELAQRSYATALEHGVIDPLVWSLEGLPGRHLTGEADLTAAQHATA